MKCRVCASNVEKVFVAKVLEKHLVAYFSCRVCGYLQTESPHWLAEAYERPINESDTGLIQRNIVLSKIAATLIILAFDRRGKFLDFAGGYGVFVRIMRDLGFDFYWQDRYSKNLIAAGFEFPNDSQAQRVELITSMETFEHFVDPLQEISEMLKRSNSILFSTTLVSDPPPHAEEWWYYGLEHGQHVGFYQHRTLKWIANHFGLTICSNRRNLHLLTSKKIGDALFNAAIPLGVVFGPVLSRVMMKSKTVSDMDLLAANSRQRTL